MNISININKKVFKHTICIKGNFDIQNINYTGEKCKTKKYFCPNGLGYKSSNAS